MSKTVFNFDGSIMRAQARSPDVKIRGYALADAKRCFEQVLRLSTLGKKDKKDLFKYYCRVAKSLNIPVDWSASRYIKLRNLLEHEPEKAEVLTVEVASTAVEVLLSASVEVINALARRGVQNLPDASRLTGSGSLLKPVPPAPPQHGHSGESRLDGRQVLHPQVASRRVVWP